MLLLLRNCGLDFVDVKSWIDFDAVKDESVWLAPKLKNKKNGV